MNQQKLALYDGDAFDVRFVFKNEARQLCAAYTTPLGSLFAADCMDVLPLLRDRVFDCVFADPPFNLGKEYGGNSNDSLRDDEYVAWCRRWIAECVRVLKPGGAIFLYNLPKWNTILGAYLSQELGLDFKHWVAIELSAGMPIPGRLYPSHYSLLYYTKGKGKTFHRIRTPIERCRHCVGEIRDYGGHRDAMNPSGVTLKDVWRDIPPVRHWKFKSKSRRANALSTKILDRVVEMATDPFDLVLDPFGGSGTTYVVCEYKRRRWVGTEIDFADEIIERLEYDTVRPHENDDYVER
jgi:site-specific DNA-methyltransferase (adenine-specific)